MESMLHPLDLPGRFTPRRLQSLQPVRIHPYFYAIIAANTENKIENTEKIASAARVLAAILYGTKHKIRIYTPKVLKFGLKLRIRETACWRH